MCIGNITRIHNVTNSMHLIATEITQSTVVVVVQVAVGVTPDFGSKAYGRNSLLKKAKKARDRGNNREVGKDKLEQSLLERMTKLARNQPAKKQRGMRRTVCCSRSSNGCRYKEDAKMFLAPES